MCRKICEKAERSFFFFFFSFESKVKGKKSVWTFGFSGVAASRERMHKCIEAQDIYICNIFTDWRIRFKRYFIFAIDFELFSIPPHNSDHNLYYILRTPPLVVTFFKLRYIQGVRLKSDVMRKLSESNRGGYERRNSFLFRGERNERTIAFVETNEIFYYQREMGWPRVTRGSERIYVRYRTRPCLLNFKSRQPNYGGCSLNRAICSSRAKSALLIGPS